MAADIKISVNGSVIASKTGVSTLSASYDISSEGAYEFKATATADGKAIDEVYSVSWVGASPEREYPGGVPALSPAAFP